METTMVQCPSCSGAKQVRALVNRGKAGCSWEMVDCPTCRGAGEVDADFARRRAEGDAIREARLKEHKSQREAAAERGMSLAEYSDFEYGRGSSR